MCRAYLISWQLVGGLYCALVDGETQELIPSTKWNFRVRNTSEVLLSQPICRPVGSAHYLLG
jgi:hypothetical protein